MCIGIENSIDMSCSMSIYRVKSVQICLDLRMVLCALWGRMKERQITENLQTPIVKEFKGYADLYLKRCIYRVIEYSEDD